LSSPFVNVLWGATNLVTGYVLIFAVGDFREGLTVDMLVVGLGALVMAIFMARHFGKVRGGL
jgi:hypothetical protein